MNDNIEKTIERIQRLCLDADIETNEGIRHFHHGHEYVEIGGVKWATMNLGAKFVTDRGLYFQWGDSDGYTIAEAKTKKLFGFETYKHCIRGHWIMAKYNSKDKKTILDDIDDAVHVNWGGNWRMPTVSEFTVLSENVIHTWKYNFQGSTVNGVLFREKGEGERGVFFPANGCCYEYHIGDINRIGNYWANSLRHTNYTSFDGNCFFFSNRTVFHDAFNWRHRGYGIRGVVG